MKPPHVSYLGGDVQVDDEVLVGHGPEEQVEVAPRQPQRLRPRPGQLQVVAGGDGAPDPVDGSLQPRVLPKPGKGVMGGVSAVLAHGWCPPAPWCRCPHYREGGHVPLLGRALPLLHAEVLEDVQVGALPGCWYWYCDRRGDGTPTQTPPITPCTGDPIDATMSLLAPRYLHVPSLPSPSVALVP